MNDFLEKFKDSIPLWGPVGWMAVLLAFLVLGMTGVSLFYSPSYEVMYSPLRMVLKADQGGRVSVFYSIEVGNTGDKNQDFVKMHFSKEAMSRALVKPYASNFGVTPRPISMTNDAAAFIVDLGGLESEKRVKLSFMLSYPKGEVPQEWKDVFIFAEPARGRAKEGDPGMTLVGRAWFSFFGRWLPF